MNSILLREERKRPQSARLSVAADTRESAAETAMEGNTPLEYVVLETATLELINMKGRTALLNSDEHQNRYVRRHSASGECSRWIWS